LKICVVVHEPARGYRRQPFPFYLTDLILTVSPLVILTDRLMRPARMIGDEVPVCIAAVFQKLNLRVCFIGFLPGNAHANKTAFSRPSCWLIPALVVFYGVIFMCLVPRLGIKRRLACLVA